MKNLPYVKEYNSMGNITNPIKDRYVSQFDNRAKRREILNQKRFHGNGKNHHLTVTKTNRYARLRQFITCITGEIKVIEHYI